jgi:putative inorganic carbon (HCO3(-)) transporter
MSRTWRDSRSMQRVRECLLPVEPGRTLPVLLLVTTMVTAPLSVTFIELFLVLTVVSTLLLASRLRLAPLRKFPPILVPLLGFVLCSVLSALLARDPVLSLLNIKKLFLFALLPAMLLLWDRPGQYTATLSLMFGAAGISAMIALIQYFRPADPGLRIHGLMGHHMTFSGQMMLVLVAMVILLTREGVRNPRIVWFLGTMTALCGAALILALTRSSWLGTATGLLVALALLRPRWLLAIPVLALLLLLVSPASVQDRLRHMFDTAEAGNAARLDMIQTGLRIVRERPLLGVGPRMIEQSVYEYGANPKILPCFYQHLHNNVIQLAAERGLPALLCWLWFMGQIVVDHFRWFRRLRLSGSRNALVYPVLAIGAAVSLFVSGLFEFNFGDSEVLALFLAIIGGAYFILYREGEPAGHAES